MAKKDRQQQRSGGWRIWHTVWCVIGTLVLMFVFSTATAVRHYVRTDNLAEALAAARLSDAAVPFTGKNVSEYIKQEYVQDDLVLTTDIALAVDEMEIPALLSEKAETWSAMLRGDSDEVVQFSADEVVDALNGSRELLYQKCLLVIEDSDVEAVREEADGILGKLNRAADTLYGSPAGRSLARFRISPVLLAVYLILIGLILWRWISVMKQSGKRASDAVRGMGRTLLIPSAIGFVLVLFFGIRAQFVRDSVIGLHGVTNAIRAPYWGLTPIGLAVAVCMLFAAMLMDIRTDRPARKERKAAVYAQGGGAEPAYDPDDDDSDPVLPQRPVKKRLCISCGKELGASARFCIYCGTNQETGGSALDDILGETKKKAKPEPEPATPESEPKPEPEIVPEPKPETPAPETAADPAETPAAGDDTPVTQTSGRKDTESTVYTDGVPELDFDWGDPEPPKKPRLDLSKTQPLDGEEF